MDGIRRDEYQEDLMDDIILQGADDHDVSGYLNNSGARVEVEVDGSVERVEVETDGSGEGTLSLTKSGEVY